MDASLAYAISGSSPASATTAVVGSVVDTQALSGGTGVGLDFIDSLDVVLAAIGGTGGTLDLYLQTSPDNATWTDLVHFVQVSAGATVKQRVVSTRWNTQNPAVVGQALVPALAVATALGAPQRYLRLVAVGGAGTTVGAAQALTLVATGPRKQS